MWKFEVSFSLKLAQHEWSLLRMNAGEEKKIQPNGLTSGNTKWRRTIKAASIWCLKKENAKHHKAYRIVVVSIIVRNMESAFFEMRNCDVSKTMEMFTVNNSTLVMLETINETAECKQKTAIKGKMPFVCDARTFNDMSQFRRQTGCPHTNSRDRIP